MPEPAPNDRASASTDDQLKRRAHIQAAWGADTLGKSALKFGEVRRGI
jgi:hypothetical protein